MIPYDMYADVRFFTSTRLLKHRDLGLLMTMSPASDPPLASHWVMVVNVVDGTYQWYDRVSGTMRPGGRMDPASPALAPNSWQDDFHNDTQALIDVGGAHISADVLEDNSDAYSGSDGETDDEAPTDGATPEINEAIDDMDRLRVNEANHAEDNDGGNNNDHANRTL